MGKMLKSAAAAIAVAGMWATGYMTAASAAVTASPAPAAPAIGPVSCGAPDVWLKLWDDTGESCYRGNGSLAVSLPGVRSEQIVGVHTVCLYASPSSSGCATGPATIRNLAPAHVEEIFISTPQG